MSAHNNVPPISIRDVFGIDDIRSSRKLIGIPPCIPADPIQIRPTNKSTESHRELRLLFFAIFELPIAGTLPKARIITTYKKAVPAMGGWVYRDD